MPKNAPIHPESARTLRDLIALHGIPAILDAMTTIAIKEAWIRPNQQFGLQYGRSEPHRVGGEGPTPENDPIGRFRIKDD